MSGASVGLSVGLIFIYGLMYGLSGGLSKPGGGSLLAMPISALTGGLIYGLIFGLIGGLGVGSLNQITLVETISWMESVSPFCFGHSLPAAKSKHHTQYVNHLGLPYSRAPKAARIQSWTLLVCWTPRCHPLQIF
jgi:hypothetical protein